MIWDLYGLVWTCMDLYCVWHAAWVNTNKTSGQFKKDGNFFRFVFCFLISGSQLLCFFPAFLLLVASRAC